MCKIKCWFLGGNTRTGADPLEWQSTFKEYKCTTLEYHEVSFLGYQVLVIKGQIVTDGLGCSGFKK